jgi:hypothetical protein
MSSTNRRSEWLKHSQLSSVSSFSRWNSRFRPSRRAGWNAAQHISRQHRAQQGSRCVGYHLSVRGFKSSASFTPASLFGASPLTPATRFGSCRIILPTPGSTSCLSWPCFSWASARHGKPLPKFPLVSLAVARLIRLATAAILLRDRAGFGVLHHSL